MKKDTGYYMLIISIVSVSFTCWGIWVCNTLSIDSNYGIAFGLIITNMLLGAIRYNQK